MRRAADGDGQAEFSHPELKSKSVISVPSGASMSGGAIVATTHMRVQEMNLQPLLLLCSLLLRSQHS